MFSAIRAATPRSGSSVSPSAAGAADVAGVAGEGDAAEGASGGEGDGGGTGAAGAGAVLSDPDRPFGLALAPPRASKYFRQRSGIDAGFSR
jgi:hypothetical protein